MNKKDEELNQKLAEWEGWEDITITPFGLIGFDPLEKQGAVLYKRNVPNFPESLDACFKRLVSLIIDKIMAEQECSSDVAYAFLFKKWIQELELIIPEAALALCKAISKLIDEGS